VALTDNCDVYVAVHEAGLNQVLKHVTRQRPSMVNIGSPAVVANPRLACAEVDAHPVVIQRGNPLIGVGPDVPVLLTSYLMEYVVQLTALQVDFSPGDVFALPGEIDPLGDQRFAVRVKVCGGLGCPSGEAFDRLVFGQRGDRGQKDLLPFRAVECLCVEGFGTGGVDFVGPNGDQRIRGRLDALEIVDIGPAGLEEAIECYIETAIRLGLLPRLGVPVVQLTEDLIGLARVTVEPTPNSPAVPNNPALEDDQIKVLLDLSVAPVGGSGGGGSGPPSTPGVPRPRVRIGDFDVVGAIGEQAATDVFTVVRDGFRLADSGSGDFGPFTLSYSADLHLEGGTLDFRSNNSISVSELDVKFDTLRACLGINIPEICVGGFCLIPIPFDGCLVEAPRLCAFSADPDLEFCLDIGGLITSEISATVRPVTKYSVNPGRTASMNDWDARDAGVPNHWQLYVDPLTIDLDLFDIADIVGDLLENALDSALDTILGGLPQWAKDLIKALLGPIIDVVRDILDFADDFGEWLSEQLGVSLGLFNTIVTAIADYFATQHPLLEIDEPVQLLAPSGSLIPVLVPIEFVGVHVTDDELILEADVGA
jgi:hypothetical protein